jgi:hypothetical protein
MRLASFVFILGLVAGLVAFEYYLLVEPLHWIARERFGMDQVGVHCGHAELRTRLHLL